MGGIGEAYPAPLPSCSEGMEAKDAARRMGCVCTAAPCSPDRPFWDGYIVTPAALLLGTAGIARPLPPLPAACDPAPLRTARFETGGTAFLLTRLCAPSALRVAPTTAAATPAPTPVIAVPVGLLSCTAAG
jgi:hypothetical protein